MFIEWRERHDPLPGTHGVNEWNADKWEAAVSFIANATATAIVALITAVSATTRLCHIISMLV